MHIYKKRNKRMKKSELRQIIKEELKSVKEDLDKSSQNVDYGKIADAINKQFKRININPIKVTPQMVQNVLTTTHYDKSLFRGTYNIAPSSLKNLLKYIHITRIQLHKKSKTEYELQIDLYMSIIGDSPGLSEDYGSGFYSTIIKIN